MKTHKRDRRGRFSIRSWFRRQVRSAIQWTTWAVQMLIRIVVLGGGMVAVGALIWGIYFTESTVTHAEVAVPVESEPAVLSRIADCESGNGEPGTGTQFDKHGQLVIHVNMTGTYAGTVDVGKYGINTMFWGKKAGELGFNLATEEGNTKMARWLYDHQGTEPWSFTSGHCWR